MYDSSSKPNWGKNDPAVQADWQRLMALSASSPAYVRNSQNELLLFAFGATPMPSKFTLQAASCADCAFLSQDDRTNTWPACVSAKQRGGFAWVEHTAETAAARAAYLTGFYSSCARSASKPACVGAAFGGFKAVYPGHGVIPRSAKTLAQTLALCGQHAEICQVVTWNDFNEGTQVAPSHWCDGKGQPMQYLQAIRAFKLGQAQQAAASEASSVLQDTALQ